MLRNDKPHLVSILYLTTLIFLLQLIDILFDFLVAVEQLDFSDFGCFQLKEQLVCTLLQFIEPRQPLSKIFIFIDKILNLHVTDMHVVHVFTTKIINTIF
jgi:hypothetical protein